MKKCMLGLLVAGLLLLGSCGVGEEIDTLGIVVGTAFDQPADPKDFSATACILKANGEFGAEGEAAEGYALVQAEAPTFPELQDMLSEKTERKAFFGQNELLVLAKTLDTRRILQAFYEDRATRGNEYVLLSDGMAAKILKSDDFLGSISAVSLREIFKSGKTTMIQPMTVHEIIKKTSQPSGACLVPIGQMDGNGFVFCGMAVLDDYRYADTLDAEETKGTWYLTRQQITYADHVELDGCIYPVEMQKVRADLSYDEQSRTMKLHVECTLYCSREKKEEICAAYRKRVYAQIEAARKKASELQVDFVEFNNTAYRSTGSRQSHPVDWYRLETEVEVRAI